jgi:CubicO group peptidase (beta-lactamase class C family)
LIERVTGVDLEEYFQENIYKPLGIKNAGFYMSSDMKANLAQMHLRLDNGTVIKVPHMVEAANQEPGTKVKCGGGSGSFATLEGFSSKMTQNFNFIYCKY